MMIAHTPIIIHIEYNWCVYGNTATKNNIRTLERGIDDFYYLHKLSDC